MMRGNRGLAVTRLLLFQTDTDECVMEMQNRVESVKHAEAQFQQLIILLQDLERGLNANKQLQDEVGCCTGPAVGGSGSVQMLLFSHNFAIN